MKIKAIIDIMPFFKAGDPPPDGYSEWHEWARIQSKAGLRQQTCRWCGLWKFPQELEPSQRRICKKCFRPGFDFDAAFAAGRTVDEIIADQKRQKP